MASSLANDQVPSVAEVDRIVDLGDPVIRNLQITQCYHELATVMAARMGSGANWCTFATWASKQAGQTIRKEDLARVLESSARATFVAVQSDLDVVTAARNLGSGLGEAEIQESVIDVLNPLGALDRASDAVGRGNRKVFQEIGREFARFHAACLNDRSFDSDKIVRFCDQLRPGDPPDGQQYLRQAFRRYYQALFEGDAKIRAELMLLANLEIGFHEQTRLQPEIAEAMDAAVIDRWQFEQRLIKALFPGRGWLARLRLFLLRLFNQTRRIDIAIDVLLAKARRLARLVITESMMTLSLPNGVRLRLGEDIPAEFPTLLKQIVLADLRMLLERIDLTLDSTRDSGAVDWSELPDRLHFIVDLFRCYHETSDLFDPPFTDEQVIALKAGRLPEGRL
jgi:hypothetical protein